MPTEPARTSYSGAGRPGGSGAGSLGHYLSQMGEARRIETERELELGRQLKRAIVELRRIASKLPPGLRDKLPPAGDGRSWSFGEIGQLQSELRLAASREPRLAALASAADEQVRIFERARRELTLANLRLVVHLARRSSRSEIDLLDLIQEGNLGLLRAVERFDPELGHRFSTYAYWWIKQAIDRLAVDKGRMIRLPAARERARRTVLAAAGALHHDLGRRPDLAEIAGRAGLSPDEVRHALSFSGSRRVEPAEGTPGLELLADSAESPEESFAREEAGQRVAALLGALGPREREILSLRFGIGTDCEHSLEEVGKRVHLSRERVRQIAARAMEKLRRLDARRSGSRPGGIGIRRASPPPFQVGSRRRRLPDGRRFSVTISAKPAAPSRV